MLYAFARDAEFRQLTRFVSPAFFRVIPAGELMSQARRLMANRRDEGRFQHALRNRATRLLGVGIPVVLNCAASEEADMTAAHPDRRSARAHQIVELYFHQLFDEGPSILDLRRTAFLNGHQTRWSPSPWFVEWDPKFIEPLRDLYCGFYSGHDHAFRSALSELGLDTAEETFRTHFGESQGKVKFVRKHFVETFQEVFVRCSEAGTRLHPNFLPLGIYLATLYDHLEQLDVPVNVERCFHRTFTTKHAQGAIHA